MARGLETRDSASIFFDERTLKDRSQIKAGVIRPLR
jgi:hypothetical protein